MKKISQLALAALVIGGALVTAVPAQAVTYYDSYGRPFYYNTWGQPVYYDTGYNSSTYYTTQATYQPSLAAVPAPAVAADSTATTYQYYYPDGSTAQTTYVSTGAPVSTTTCRQSAHTVQNMGEIETRYTTECLQPNGVWIEQ